MKCSFISANEVVTKCLIKFRSLDHVFTERFPLHVVITQLLYKVKTIWLKLKSLPQHFPCCTLWDMKFLAGSYSLLFADFSRNHHEVHQQFPCSLATGWYFYPYRYTLRLKTFCTNLWVGFRRFITVRRSKATLNSFRLTSFMDTADSVIILYNTSLQTESYAFLKSLSLYSHLFSNFWRMKISGLLRLGNAPLDEVTASRIT
jgi:hypothetical protein